MTPFARWSLRLIAAVLLAGIALFTRDCRYEFATRWSCRSGEFGFLEFVGLAAIALAVVVAVEKLRFRAS
ncbi:MAG: hypothetical protein J0H94_11870 [Rhizobiales bacterium]|nr:hypothetical protein [Hyphomicrobiales bacterium]